MFKNEPHVKTKCGKNAVTTFSQMTLFGSWTTYYVSATCEKVGHM